MYIDYEVSIMTRIAIFDVRVFSHFFKVTKITPAGMQIINIFCRKFVQHGMVRKPGGKYQFEPIKIFAAATRDKKEFRFHKNAMSMFIEFLATNYITSEMYDISEEPMYLPAPLDAKVNPKWVLREYQKPVVEYIIADDPLRTKMVELDTGRGKGMVSIYSMSIINTRVVLLIKSGYIEKWVEELLEILLIKPEDIMCISGSAQLKALIDLAINDTLYAKIIIISNKTYQNYIKTYELDPTCIDAYGYGCKPDEFFRVTRAGERVIDEVHQDSHLNFKFDLYTHVHKILSLSATLLSNDAFIERMYEIMYPKANRYREDIINKHIASAAITYSLRNGLELKHREFGSTTYSHHVFEQSILRIPKVRSDYFNMIRYIAEIGYFQDYVKGDRLAIFCTSIKMCTVLTEQFKIWYPDYDIRRYVEDDPYENVIDADVRITTILSGGTAVDIPGLVCSILTVAVSSVVSNRQTFGRLRPITGRETKFYYFVCENIPKHIDYHGAKKVMLLERAKSFRELLYPSLIG